MDKENTKSTEQMIVNDYKQSIRKLGRLYYAMIQSEGTIFLEASTKAYYDFWEKEHYPRRVAFEKMEAEYMLRA